MSRAKDDQRFLDAALESARFFNGAMAEAAATAGMFDALSDFASSADVCARMGFHRNKVALVESMLDVMVDAGVVERKHYDGTPVYRAKGKVIQQRKRLDGGLGSYQVKSEVIEPWQSGFHAETVRDYMLRFVGDDLSFLRGEGRIQFNAKHLEIWHWNLMNPMYEWGRVRVVRDLVQYGNKFLDLACGPGFGTERLVQLCDGPCEVVGVDKSRDFLDFASKAIYPSAKVKFIHRDLNDGLPPLPQGYFDGILFNGAFHFIKDKPALLRDMRRVLRPGGLLVIGHCFSRSGFSDEAMHDVYFRMIENACYVESWEAVRSHVSGAGFEELSQFHRGSHSYLTAQRDLNPGDAPDARQAGAPALLFG